MLLSGDPSASASAGISGVHIGTLLSDAPTTTSASPPARRQAGLRTLSPLTHLWQFEASDRGAVSMAAGGRKRIDSGAAPRYTLTINGGTMPSWSIQAVLDEASRMMMPGAWCVAGSGIMHK